MLRTQRNSQVQSREAAADDSQEMTVALTWAVVEEVVRSVVFQHILNPLLKDKPSIFEIFLLGKANIRLQLLWSSYMK